MVDWEHIAVELLGTISGTTVPIALYIWNNKRMAKKDAEERHRETQDLVDSLVTERRYFPSHKHKENEGSLTAKGIEYPPGSKVFKRSDGL